MKGGKALFPKGEGQQNIPEISAEDEDGKEDQEEHSIIPDESNAGRSGKTMAGRDDSERDNGRHIPEYLRPSRSTVRKIWSHNATRNQKSTLPPEAPPAEEAGQSGVGGGGTNITLLEKGGKELGSPVFNAHLSKISSGAFAAEEKNGIPCTSGTVQEGKKQGDLIMSQKVLPTKEGNAYRTDPVASAGPAEDRSSLERRETEENKQAKLGLEGLKDGSPSEPKPCLVCVRVRPESLHEISAGGHLCVDTRHASAGAVTVSGYKDRQYTFHFDHVFDQAATQEAIYHSTCDCLLEKLLSGYSASVMAYGQTGAGKTYTMLGEVANYDFHRALMDPTTRGLVPRMLEALFQRILKENSDWNEREGGGDQQTREDSFEQGDSGKPGMTFSVRASLVEVYNDTVRDLLAPHRDGLSIRDTTCSGSRSINSGAVLTEATEVPVTTAQEAFSLIYTGFAHRAHGTTLLNEQSSRSHAIFQLIIRRNSMTGCRVTCSRLCLVDLAGSERVSKADSSGARLREAQSINKSLLALGNVISAVPQTQKGQKQHVPYRDSKLTRLLQHSFGGHTFTVLLLCCSPHTFNVKETLSTLRFGDRAANLKNQPLSVETVDPELLLQRLQEAQIELRISQAQIRAYVVQTARQVDAIKMLRAYMPGEVSLSDDEEALLKLALQEIPVLTQNQRLQLLPPAPAGAPTNRRGASTNRSPKLPATQPGAHAPAAQRRGASSPKALESAQGQKKLPQERGRADRESASTRPKTAPFHPARPTNSVSQRGSPPPRRPVEQKKLHPTQREHPELRKPRSLPAKEGDLEKPLRMQTSGGNQEVTHAADATPAQEKTMRNNAVLKDAREAEETRKPSEDMVPTKDEEKKGGADDDLKVERNPSKGPAEEGHSAATGTAKDGNTTRISREKTPSRLSKFFSLSRGRSVNSKVGSRGQQGIHSKSEAKS